MSGVASEFDRGLRWILADASPIGTQQLNSTMGTDVSRLSS